MKSERLIEFYKSYKGEIIGSTIGALFGIFVVTIGFWKSLFIGLCISAGFFIGKKFSTKEDLVEFLDKVLPPGK